MGEPLVLGIDVGTTATKVGVFDRSGVPRGTATAGYPIHRRHQTWAEQDPDDWWRACMTALSRLAATVDLADVRSVGVVSQVNTHVFVDANLRPIGPAILWQDQRCATIARELDARVTPQQRETAWDAPFVIDSSRLVARAAWLARHEPANWTRTRWVLSPKDYVTMRLTGLVATDALSSIGLVDQWATRYLPEVTSLVEGLDRRLPELRTPTSRLGSVVDGDCGLPAGTSVVVGTMDAWGNLYGSAATTPGAAIVVGGTSAIVAAVSDRHVPTPGVITFPRVGGFTVHAGPTQAAGDAVRWWAGVRGSTVDSVLADASAAPAGAHGVLFLPHLLGERAPLWDAEARGTFLGVSSATTHHDFARAVIEGVAFSARELFDAIEQAAGRPAEPVALSGGTTRSDLWCQIKASVLDRPLGRLAVRDSAVLGAAILGGVGAGAYPSIDAAARQAVHVERVFEPEPAAAARYAEYYEIYRASYHALREVHARLSAVRGTWRKIT